MFCVLGIMYSILLFPMLWVAWASWDHGMKGDCRFDIWILDKFNPWDKHVIIPKIISILAVLAGVLLLCGSIAILRDQLWVKRRGPSRNRQEREQASIQEKMAKLAKRIAEEGAQDEVMKDELVVVQREMASLLVQLEASQHRAERRSSFAGIKLIKDSLVLMFILVQILWPLYPWRQRSAGTTLTLA